MANIDNCFIKLNADFTAASGWLQRLVRSGRRSPLCNDDAFWIGGVLRHAGNMPGPLLALERKLKGASGVGDAVMRAAMYVNAVKPVDVN